MFLSHGLLVSCFKIWRSLSLMVLYNQSLGTLGKKEGIKYWSKRYTIGTPSNLFYQQPKNFIVCGCISTINLFSLLSRSLVGYVALSDLSMASGKSNDFDVRNIIILKMRKYMRYFSFCCFFFFWYQTKYINFENSQLDNCFVFYLQKLDMPNSS